MSLLMKNIANVLVILHCMLHLTLIAQDDEPEVAKPVFLKIKTQGLYDSPEPKSNSFHGFSQLSVFDGTLSDAFWHTLDTSCIQVDVMLDTVNSSSLKVIWNKDQVGCDWVGMGFGWDSWSSKDMAYLRDSLAFEVTLRSTKRPLTNLPWAFGIEDYTGNQCWLGFKKEFLKESPISTSWTTFLIPLNGFPISENDVDLTATKQFIIQCFAVGEIELKSIQLVPHK